jgi:hypothetical protein
MISPRMRIAIHEASHAAVALANDLPVVDAVLDDNGGGRTRFRLPPGGNPDFRRLVVVAAGNEGERLLAGGTADAHAAHAEDRQQAITEAERLSGGDGRRMGYLIHAAREQAADIVQRNADIIMDLAAELDATGYLEGGRVVAIAENRVRPADPPTEPPTFVDPPASRLPADNGPRPYAAPQDANGNPLPPLSRRARIPLRGPAIGSW